MQRGVQIQQSENGVWELRGFVDANFEITPLLESTQQHLILNLANIVQINSIGIKKWAFMLRELYAKGKTLEFHECSEMFIMQCNFVPELHQGVKIHSFKVLFECEDCDEVEARYLKTDELNLDQLPPVMLCPACHKPMPTENSRVFDFLTRKK